ncbi:ZIP family metal transporter, partial [Acidobacteria bacterium AH-259-D05]|nr:ZIP family metal transporter [Acidobacteria bacterium AH-259-D05]
MSSTEVLYTVGSVLMVSLVSLVGIALLFLRERILNYVTLLLVSFSSGTLFGNAFIHLLPETVDKNGFTIGISIYTLCGIAGSFVVEKIVRWRHVHSPAGEEIEAFAYMNLLGDAVHNLLDGVVIAGAYAIDICVGVATTIAILFHEIPQEMGDFGVLVHGGLSRQKALFFNFVTALTALVGAIVTMFLISLTDQLTVFLIPFSAGTFIYIAGSDLIPQLHKEKAVKDSLLQLGFFVLG